MAITVLKNNVPWGPFTRAQIDDSLARGDFTVKYLAHAPGLKEWLPLGEVLDYVDKSASPIKPSLPPIPASRDLPPMPPAPPTPEPAAPVSVPPSRPPVLPASIPAAAEKPEIKPVEKPEVPLTPASFFQRAFAFLIDCAILFVPVAVLYLIGVLVIWISARWHHIPDELKIEQSDQLKNNMRQLFWMVLVGFGWLYVAGFESSPSQATVGKRWMGIKVADAQGMRMSFLRATGRYAAKYLSALPCFLGFIMALFSSRGLALHDRLADTRVVRE
ncbi:MAG TPA: RDD family protein [Candidatus Methylacidiphilales bacterium]|jgi:uncharacterized RDD family membrane protein YckC|nr:RDD family protein [Candidatus Methylacidiphilales bacterium]